VAGTKHLQIRNALAALLEAQAGLADGGVKRGKRTRAMAEQFKRQVHVLLDAAPVDRAEFSGHPDDWMTRIRFECCARADDVAGLDGEENADDLAKAVYGVLGAAIAADPTLGGLVMDLIPLAMAWDTDEADSQLAIVQLAYDAKHRTPSTSIAA
jgi:hypothetical protein